MIGHQLSVSSRCNFVFFWGRPDGTAAFHADYRTPITGHFTSPYLFVRGLAELLSFIAFSPIVHRWFALLMNGLGRREEDSLERLVVQGFSSVSRVLPRTGDATVWPCSFQRPGTTIIPLVICTLFVGLDTSRYGRTVV